jgi:ribosomal protein S6--L-glutamate ligase
MCDLPDNGNPDNSSGRDIAAALTDCCCPQSATPRVSLGKRLRKSSVACFGINPNWNDYPEEIRKKIADASKVFYPGPVYEQILIACGKDIFPRNYYLFLGNKIAQSDLFQLLEIPHPKTRIYYGRNRLFRIDEDFTYPFVAKTPVGSSQGLGVFLIQEPEELSKYLESHNPAYIQEFLPLNRDLRAVIIGGSVVHAYWRIHRPGDFRNNVSRGGRISFENVPEAALDFARSVALRCRFDEVGLDICEHESNYFVLEANMVFGLEGFREKGMDIHEILARMAEEGTI